MTEDSPVPPRAVEMRVPADGTFVAILRTVAAGLAARCDLTLDEIEDLRLAVDEACALLLPHAAPDASLTARFVLHSRSLAFIASVPAEPGAQPDKEGFAWTVLRALADDLRGAKAATISSSSASPNGARP